jgi:acetyl esterase/lipase
VPTLDRLLVVGGSRLPIDRTALRDYCRSLTADLGLPVVVGTPDDVRTGDGVLRIGDDGAPCHKFTGPVACVDLRAAVDRRDEHTCVVSVRGRGIDGLRWAAHALLARTSHPPARERYGLLADQVGDLRVPEGGGPHPVIVLIHGGGWRECWERDIMDPLAVELTRCGYATWNIEYRRVGPSGGGWPQTVEDAAAAVAAVTRLAERYPIDPERTALLGHSAGGHLAVCAAARGTASALVVLSGALDLDEIGARGTGDGSGIDFMGGLPRDHPEAYASASPLAQLPLGSLPQLVVYGTRERIDLIDGVRRYCDRARDLGDDVETLVLEDADHFSVIDPRTPAWDAIGRRVEHVFPVRANDEETKEAG